jgi:adenine-specific DNA glycosylase
MPAFPVDTHVLRVTKRLGLVPGTATLAKAALSLEPYVGSGDHGPLHLNLIRLGREVCRPRNPLCETCPLLAVCPEGKRKTKAHATGGSGRAAAGGGRSEVKRSRAGSPHGEPRTESPSETAQPEGKGFIA